MDQEESPMKGSGGPGAGGFRRTPPAAALPGIGTSREAGESMLSLALAWRWRILAASIAAAGLAGVVATALPPNYTASASVMIDARQLRLINAEQLLSNQLLDTELLRTEMALFGTPQLARTVVERLGLDTVPEFCGSATTASLFAARLKSLVTARPAAAQAPCHGSVEEAAKRLRDRISVANDGRSYIIEVTAEAGDPTRAAAIANAYANAFIDQRRTERAAVAHNAREWLASYVTGLRDKVMAAEATVSEYRNQYHLTPVRGETLAAQSLVELNTRLTDTTTELAQKQGMAAQLRTLQSASHDYAAAAPNLNSPLIQELLIKEADTANLRTQLETQFGDAHPSVVAATGKLAELHQQIRSESAKAVAGLDREIAALGARRAGLSAQIAELQSRLKQQGDDDVRLRELERDADTDRQVYQASLTRLREIEAQEGMEQSDAHLVAEAVSPEKPSAPHRVMMIIGAFLASLGTGAGLAIVSGLLSRTYRDEAQLSLDTGVDVLGLFPRPPRGADPATLAADAPQSIEAEALHRILVSLTADRADEARHQGRVVLLTSALPGDGKTSFAVALGRTAELSGFSTVLLDCDLRRPGVSALLKAGTATSDDSAKPVAELGAEVLVDPRTGLTAYAFGGETVAVPHRVLASAQMRALLDRLRSRHDLILIDTPPLLAVPDALALAPAADGVLLLVDRVRTTRESLEEAILLIRRSGGALLGFVLSKVDLRKYAHRYRGYPYGRTVSPAPIAISAPRG